MKKPTVSVEPEDVEPVITKRFNIGAWTGRKTDQIPLHGRLITCKSCGESTWARKATSETLKSWKIEKFPEDSDPLGDCLCPVCQGMAGHKDRPANIPVQ